MSACIHLGLILGSEVHCNFAGLLMIDSTGILDLMVCCAVVQTCLTHTIVYLLPIK